MPYITQDRRDRLYIPASVEPEGPGELNYVLSQVMLRYWQRNPQHYVILNDISGAATEALAEFRRRVIVPYEDTKIAENGDIYS